MRLKNDKLCQRGSIALLVVNGLLLFACGHQLHKLVLRHGELPGHAATTSHALLHMPSALMVVLQVALLAILIGKEWLRPAWLPLVLNLVWLVVSVLLLFKLTIS